MATLAQLNQYAANPNVRRMLDLISKAEGTYKYGYNAAFRAKGYSPTFSDLSKHPNYRRPFKQTNGKTNYSSAAGRYQFMGYTWGDLAKRYGFKDFSARSQDLGAIARIVDRGAIKDVLSGNFKGAVKKLGVEWASLPSAPAKYKQPKKSWSEINKLMGSKSQQQDQFLNIDQATEMLKGIKTQSKPAPAPKDDYMDLAAATRVLQGIKAKEAQKDKGFFDKVGSYAGSAGAGMANLTGGILQGVGYVGDQINHKINDTFGTNLSTDGYKGVTEDLQRMNEQVDTLAVQSGRKDNRKDADIIRGGTELVGSIPMFAGAGMGLGSAKLLSKGGAAFAAKNAGAGAAVSAMEFSEDGEKRKDKMLMGAALAPLGAAASEKLIAPVVKKGGEKWATRNAKKAGRIHDQARKLVDKTLQKNEIKLTPQQRNALVNQTVTDLSNNRLPDVTSLVRSAHLAKLKLKGTRAQLTGKATDWQQERELSKIIGVGDGLRQKHIDDSDNFKRLLDDMAERTGGVNQDAHATMRGVFDDLKAADKTKREEYGSLYDDAIKDLGADVPIRHDRMLDEMEIFLEANGASSFMPKMHGMVNHAISMSRDSNFTLKNAEELKKALNGIIGRSSDGSERWAAGQMKKIIDESIDQTVRSFNKTGDPHMKGFGENLERGAKKFAEARGTYAKHMQDIENTPALKAAIDDKRGADKAFKKYIVNSDARDVKALLKYLDGNDKAKSNLQFATLKYISDMAVPEGKRFSLHNFNKAINSIGERKMQAMFSRDQLAQLNDLKRAGDILFKEPDLSFINRSNTDSARINSSAILKKLIAVMSGLSHIPRVGNTLSGLGIGAVEKLEHAGAKNLTHGMLNGDIATQKTFLGLTPEQIQRISRAGDAARGAGAATATAGQ